MTSLNNKKLSNNFEEEETDFISHGLCMLSLREENGKKIFVKRYKQEDSLEALRELVINRKLKKNYDKSNQHYNNNFKRRNQNYIVKYLGSFKDKNYKFGLKFEYSKVGTLFDYYISEEFQKKKIDEKNEIIRKFVTQITKALLYVHKQGIIHNDLKLENILLFESQGNNNKIRMVAKLADFNNSLLYNTDKKEIIKISDFDHIPCSSMFPYLIEYPSLKTDFLFLGVLIYQLVTGKHSPFENKNLMQMNKMLRNKEYLQNEEFSSKKMNSKIRDLIVKLFEYDPNLRIGDEEILQQPFFKYNQSCERKRIRLIKSN